MPAESAHYGQAQPIDPIAGILTLVMARRSRPGLHARRRPGSTRTA